MYHDWRRKSSRKKRIKKFILKDESLSKKFNLRKAEDQEGTIPYEMITKYNSLDISPEEGNFFLPHHFYSSLKETLITDEYNQVEKFYQTLKLKDLSKLNKIYNFQETIFVWNIWTAL